MNWKKVLGAIAIAGISSTLTSPRLSGAVNAPTNRSDDAELEQELEESNPPEMLISWGSHQGSGTSPAEGAA